MYTFIKKLKKIRKLHMSIKFSLNILKISSCIDKYNLSNCKIFQVSTVNIFVLNHVPTYSYYSSVCRYSLFTYELQTIIIYK